MLTPTFEAQFSPFFDPDQRYLGGQLFRNGKCSLADRSTDYVAAHVDDAEENYIVIMQRDLRDLRVSCDCEQFESRQLCHHLWTALLFCDQRQLLRYRYKSLPQKLFIMVEDDPASPYLTPIQMLPRFGQTAPAAKKMGWDALLARATPTPSYHYNATADWPPLRQLIYALNASLKVPIDKLCIELFTSDVLRSGQYGKCKPAFIKRRQIPQIPDPADVEILTIMSGPDHNAGYDYYGDLQSTNYLESFFGKLLIPKLCATGRFRLMAPPELLVNNQPISLEGGEPWKFTLRIVKNESTYRLDGGFQRGSDWLPMPDPAYSIHGAFLLRENTISPAEIGGHENWIKFLTQHSHVDVPIQDGPKLLQSLLTRETVPALDVPPELRYEVLAIPPKPHLRVHAGAGQSSPQTLQVSLSFQYEQNSITADSKDTGFYDPASMRYLQRDTAAERTAVAQLVKSGVKVITGQNSRKIEYEVTAKQLPKLVQQVIALGFEVETEGRLIKRPSHFNIGISSGIDWFELHAKVDYDGHEINLPQLLKALERGETMIQLGDGSFGMLPEEWIKQMGILPDLGEAKGDHLRFKKHQAGFLDALLLSQPATKVDETFQQARAQLRSFEGIAPGRQPAGFQGTLRGYQLEGLGWFEFLRRFQFGGCLADDMGVGKTAQVLAMLEERRQQTPAPSLVVAPKSLIFNWKQEAARFTPQLRVFDYTGAGRAKQEIENHDLILTTYGTLLRDIASLREIQFDYAILDESQAIKNATTESAKAARLLNAKHRLALSGTPVENHLGELWSLFEFLNPGMLGAASVFKLAGSAGRSPSEDTRLMLARAVRPFILRRTKDQVIKELPEKSEQTLYCELEPAQRKVYNELRDHYRARLLKMVDSKGLAKSKIQVLEALLRLRQAACHPRLIDSQAYTGPSAKLDMLLMQLDEIRQSGHKALVFSQFTSLLAIVRESLDRDRIPYAYLDGQTADRQAAVRQFQEDPACPLFLISLKAGGVGLNLTAAEYVFLLDPWWNPAVEAQAVDRAHRIGQQRRVFAYRLIARDTVEEKVLALQNTKRDLADSIINAENSIISNLGREDLELLLS